MQYTSSTTKPLHYSKTETMDEIAYAFFLAYGMSEDDEQLNSLLDVEMYNMLKDPEGALFEARDSSVLTGDTSEAKATRFEF